MRRAHAARLMLMHKQFECDRRAMSNALWARIEAGSYSRAHYVRFVLSPAVVDRQ